VRDLASQQQFLLKAINDRLISCEIGPDDFQRNGRTQLAVHGLVNGSHASFAQNLENFVALS
jgi:hypothetical protein